MHVIEEVPADQGKIWFVIASLLGIFRYDRGFLPSQEHAPALVIAIGEASDLDLGKFVEGVVACFDKRRVRLFFRGGITATRPIRQCGRRMVPGEGTYNLVRW